MNAKEALADIVPLIDAKVEKILEEEKKESNKISPIIADILKNVPVVCFGGKRLRGAFIYYSYLMFGGKDIDEILKVSAVFELLHSYLLAHDDVMDKSNMRHRKPTLHKIYQNKIRHEKPYFRNSRHFGESIAVNIGDGLSHLASLTLAESTFQSERKMRVFSKFSREFLDTVYGQVIDVYGEVKDDVDEDYVLKVHYYKTGKYTYETPLHVGAILAGAKDEDLKALTEYAIPGGIAFQIQDDILGMFGDEYRIGKPANSDLKEGKKTLLIIKALENGNRKQIEIINRNLGNPHIKSKDLEDVRKVIIDTGSLEYSKQKALKLVKKAQKALDTYENPKWQDHGREFLDSVADYMITRDL